jgi:predicted lipid-binding transport protein (Tim44 family)
MRNLNEPLRREPKDVKPEQTPANTDERAEANVVSINDRQRHVSESRPSLIQKGDIENFRQRWNAIQTSFVDEPRRAVKDADQLVSTAIQQLSETFRNQRGQLEKLWSSGEQVSTEDLRVCLQQYRMFFDRLLST